MLAQARGPPERPPLELGSPGIELFGMQGMSFHMAFPGMAEPGVREVSVTVGSETTTFPVFEPLGFYLAVVPDRPPGSELRLTGRPGAESFVYDVWRGS